MRVRTEVAALQRGPWGAVAGVRTTGGETVAADAVVLAVPPWRLGTLIEPFRGLQNLRRAGEALGAAPIVNVDLWFDRPWLDVPYAGLLGGGPVQWVFRHGHDAAGHRVSLVASAADALGATPRQELLAACLAALRRRFPAARKARPTGRLVIRIERATFRPRPGTAAFRPPTRTQNRRVFLAGDWTATGLPATIEGAVVSGERAAAAVLGPNGGG